MTPAVHLHADVLKAHVLGAGAAADGEQHLVRRNVELLAVRLADDLALFHGQTFGGEFEVYALLGVLLLEHLGNLAVGGAGDVVEHLNDGDVGAGHAVVSGHLQADDAAADDDEVLRHFRQLQHFAVGEHEIAQVLLDAGDGRHDRLGTGADEQLGGFVVLTAGGDGKAALDAALMTAFSLTTVTPAPFIFAPTPETSMRTTLPRRATTAF